MVNLTEHFTLEELTQSKSYPKIPNKPTDKVRANLLNLCKNILEPARVMMDQPIIITSGYRCEQLNKAVGGVPNSYHLTGQAADIHITSEAFAKRLLDIFALNRHVDLALYEHNKKGAKWVHVQTNANPRNMIIRDYHV